MKHLYFAYGSNLDPDQMRCRCSKSQFAFRATLPDYKLAFTRYSKVRKCGVADVVEKAGDNVWGVVYEITDDDLKSLDCCEGFDVERAPCMNAYNRKQITVYREGDSGSPEEVQVYIAVKQSDPPPPSREYMQHLIRGACHQGLPEKSIEYLKNVETSS